MKRVLIILGIITILTGCVVADPYYIQPQPVYVQPRPVYVQPRPVYVQPRPIYVNPPRRPHCYNETYYNRNSNTQVTRRICR
jgi:hypothetical protein